MMDQFAALGIELTARVRASLAEHNIVSPTQVQAAAIGHVLAQRDIVIQSGTGTGKTLAYLLPLLQRAAADATLCVVVLAPVPELAVQILRTCEAYKEAHVTSVGLIGGGSVERQRERLKKHPQIMVGTPGRVLDFVLAKKIKSAKIGCLVLDEVDTILSPDNEEALLQICSRPEFVAQIICASATFQARAKHFAQARMKPDCVTLEVDGDCAQSQVRHVSVPFSQQRKETALLALLHKHRIKRAIVFVNKLYNVGHLYRLLCEQGVPAASLSTERNKMAREQAMRAIRSEVPCILLATDAAARGIDIKALDWVIHYEMARDVATYVHRAGRTGRAGRDGTSLVMAAFNEQHLVRRCEKELGIRFVPATPRESC